MNFRCPVDYKIEYCSSSEYGYTCDTCYHMKKFRIVYYNRFACENQTFNVIAKDEDNAKRLFWLKFERENYHDCIEYVYEVENEHFYTESEILKEVWKL